jgi:hypothetical protein
MNVEAGLREEATPTPDEAGLETAEYELHGLLASM